MSNVRVAHKSRADAAKKARTEEEVAKDLEMMAAVAHQLRWDVWNQPVQTLGEFQRFRE